MIIYNDIYNESLYGNYRTKKFADIYGDYVTFEFTYKTVGIPQTISTETLKTLYYLLYARYGNSHIANSDENQFTYKLFSTIFMYGPTWEKRLDLQEKIRSLTEEDLIAGSRQILNHSYNPSTEPSTNDLEELPTINEQNTSGWKKSKLDAYMSLWGALETDVTESFLIRFKKLFLKVVEPQIPLWYETEIEEE